MNIGHKSHTDTWAWIRYMDVQNTIQRSNEAIETDPWIDDVV